MKKPILLSVFIFITIFTSVSFAQSSWTGAVNTDWSISGNWTNGIPNTTVDAIIGDASFTTSNQPTLSSNSACKSLILGGAIPSTLTINKNNLAISGNFTNNSNGTISLRKANLSINGNFINNGTFSGSGPGNSNASNIILGGSYQTIGGSSTTFENVIINNGSIVTLTANITVAGSLNVNGTINPSESPAYKLTTSGTFNLGSTGTLKVTGALFTDNYGGTTPTISVGSIIEYSSTTFAQTIAVLTYSNLKISGTTVKSLTADLPGLSSTSSSDGNIFIVSSTLDLSSFIANRASSGGGSLIVSNGATLKIGGTSTMPVNYTTYTFSLTSTTEYNGGNQVIDAETYGNLRMSSSGGVTSKTASSTAFTINGNFITAIGSGTSLTFTSGAAITVSGIDSIGASTTFDAGSFTHILAGNVVNSGTLTGNSSTINMTGAGSSISGTGTFNYNTLGIYASKITAISNTNLNIAGNFLTVSPGMFTHSGGTFTMTGNSNSISGNDIVFNNLVISGTISSGNSFIIAGNLTVNTGKSFTATGNIVTMNGTSKNIAGSGIISFSQLSIPGSITTSSDFSISSALDVSGIGSSFTASSGTATFSGTATLNGTANLYNITLSGTSLKLATNSILGVANTLGTGTLDVTTAMPNTVFFNGSGNQNIPSSNFYNLIMGSGGTKTAAGGITVNGVFTVNSGAVFNASSYVHSFYNNFINNGTFTASTSDCQFRGSKDVTISGVTTFNTLTINKTSSGNIISLLSNVTVGTAVMTNGEIKTGSRSITMTNGRSGPGIIIGTITRQQVFLTGVDYEFESPYNKINFNSLSGVTSLTETVTLGLISDFPYISAVYREYDFSVPSGTYNANVYLHYENSELAGNNKSTMQFWGNSGGGWTQMGKTGFDATNNFVYTNNITNLLPRYTLCSVNSVYRWTGKINTDWNTPGNWSYVQGGNPQGLPGSSDVVLIGDTTFTNQPNVSQLDSAKTVLFYSTTASTLTVSTGGTLVSGGNILGFYTGNVNHNINIGNQNLTIGGNLILSDGTSNHTINISSGSGTISVGQSLTQSGGANLILSSGNISVYGDYNYISGNFSPGTGTFGYNGSQTQIFAGVTYNKVIINKISGTADASTGNPVINGNFALIGGEFTFDVNTTVNGNFIFNNGTILNGGVATLNIGGNWTSLGSFSAGSSTINFNGSGAQSIAATTFNNFVVSKSAGTATLLGNISIEGNMSVTGGTLDLATYSSNRTSLGGSLSIAANATLSLSANNFPSIFSSNSLDTLSTVNYYGSTVQTLAAIAYGNLTLMNGGTNAKSITALTTVNGDVNINTGATLNGSSYSIWLGGNWINSGTYIPSSSTVILNGTSKSITGNTNFNKVTVYGNYVVNSADITYNGLLNVTSAASYASGLGTATFIGDFLNSGTLTSTGKIVFAGTQVQTIRLLNAVKSTSTGEVDFNGTVSPILNSTSSPQFAVLKINNTGGVSPSVGWTVFTNFIVAAGATFNGGLSTHNFYGGFTNSGTITSTGVMNIAPTTSVAANLLGTSFSSTGTVIFGGRGLLTVSGTPTSLKDVVVANSNVAGLTPSSDWNVSGNFTIRDTAIFNATNHNFLVNGDFTSNGSLLGGTSTFNIKSDTSILSGSANTNFYNLKIDYLNQAITGKVTAKSDFNVMGNFINNGKLDVSAGTLRFTGSTPSIISGTSTDTLSQIDIAKTGNLVSVTLGANVNGVDNLDIISGTLSDSTFAINQDNISGGVGALFLRANATLKLGGTSTFPTFALNSVDSLSTVWYYGTIQTIASLIKPVPYGFLKITSSGATSSAGPINIRSDFSLSNSAFTMGNFNDTLAGNWTMTSGTLIPGSSTLTLNGVLSQTINSTGSFNNLTINKNNSNAILSSNLTFNGTLSFLKGSINTGINTLIMGAAGVVTGAAANTGWINGKLQIPYSSPASVVQNFTLGDAVNYTPLSLTLTATGTGSVTGSTTATDHPNIGTSTINGSNSVNRYWTLNNTGLTIVNASVTPTWVSGDLDPNATPLSFGVGVYNASAWTYPTVGTRTSTSIVASALTNLGDIAIGLLSTVTTWTGIMSTEWNLAGNWTGGIPTSTINAVIPVPASGRYPVISTALATTNAITINASLANLTVTGQTLQIYGSITNSGTLTASAGTIEMKGTVAQTIPSGAFANKLVSNLIISNASGVTLGDTLGITNTLSFGNINNAVLNTGGLLAIKSSISNTGRIADATNNGVNNGNIINGNVTVERYIPSNNLRGYRFLASSVNSANSIHANWQEGAASRTENTHPGYGTHITGSKTDQRNGFDGTQTGNPSFYRYDVASNNFIPFANTNVLTLHDTTGYLMYFRGDRTINLDLLFANQGSTSTTLRATGSIVQGSRIYSTLVGNSNANGGFNLIANPYAAPISWASIYAANTNLTKYFTYFDPKLNAGSYVTVDNSGVRSNPSSTATVEIQSGEAFFIQASTVTAPILTIAETHKSTNNNITVFKATGAPQTFYTSLFINDALGRRNADGVLNTFDVSFNNRVDNDDAPELENFNENIAISRSGSHLSIEERNLPVVHTDTIQLYMSNMNQKNYDLQFNVANITPGVTAQLVDKFTGVKSLISFDTATVVPFTVTASAASSDSNRFYILLNPAVALPVTITSFSGLQKNNGVSLQWNTSQQINTDRYEIERSFTGNNFEKIGMVKVVGNLNNMTYDYFDNVTLQENNFYRLKIIDKNSDFSYSKIIVIHPGIISATVSVYPNPVIGKAINLQLNNLEKGNYNVKLVDKLGQVVFQKIINHSGGSATQVILLEKQVAKGSYQLMVGEKYTIQVMIQ